MSDEKDLQNVNDDVISVELGDEANHLTVEEEMAAVTPVEENTTTTEQVTEEQQPETTEESKQDEEPVQEEEKKKEEEEQTDTAPSENTSEENEENAEEKPEENSEDTPPVENEELDENTKLRLELYEMKEAEETRKLVETREQTIAHAVKEYDDFNHKLQMALADTFKDYGIDIDKTIEDIQKEDPAKYAIVEDLMRKAQQLQMQKQAELMKPVTEISNKIVFREAGKAMADYPLTPEQSKVAAETFVNIMNTVGLADLGADLKAKMELAVARAKMIAPDVVKVVEEVKEAVKEVVETKAPEKTEEVEKKLEKKVIEEKPSLEAFKEGAVKEATNTPSDPITEDNVLETLASLPTRERTAFLVKYKELIDKAASKRRG